MTEWVFWGDRQMVSVYGNIYLRTFVEDWFKIIDVMAKSRTQFICQNCGANYQKWTGKCDNCGEWNTLSMAASSTAAIRQ